MPSIRFSPSARGRGAGSFTGAALILAGALTLAGCASDTARTTPVSSLTATRPDLPVANGAEPYWWRTTGDPVLARLVETGLAQNRDLACKARSLNAAQASASAKQRRIDSRIRHLFDTRDTDVTQAELASRAYRFAAQRAQLAEAIALAYIETRRLQATLVAQSRALNTDADNAEIAGFRKEAGLVSGLDTGLADTSLVASHDALETLRTRFEDARAALAGLVGLPVAELQAQLGEDGSVPAITLAAPARTTRDELDRRADLLALERSLIAHLIATKVSQDELDAALARTAGEDGPQGDTPAPPEARPQTSDGVSTDDARAQVAVRQWRAARDKALAQLADARDRLAVSAQRESDLAQAIARAHKTSEAARLAYRTGTGDFATLYVAERTALGLDVALIGARAAQATASVQAWTAQGLGWSQSDLAPPAPPGDGPEVLVCE
ncbi:TolC family protein [Novosphingobium sp. 1949]|uniref:TolC family protein n=1 Tax=Novosphingobium organovorum TaxID=2930092 RepID=A0ABT0BEL9_9SPHN|nr:TolC family protein [Novosphingobium organovorum]MCJ2183428.1 TolC family protein [Novosphingobium organovorum]